MHNHVRLSKYYNYKLFHSIILTTMVDAHYRVILFDVGINGRNSDAGVFASSTMSSALENNTLNVANIAPPRALPYTREICHIGPTGDASVPFAVFAGSPTSRGVSLHYIQPPAITHVRECFGMAVKETKGDHIVKEQSLPCSIADDPNHGMCPNGEGSWCGYNTDQDNYRHKHETLE